MKKYENGKYIDMTPEEEALFIENQANEANGNDIPLKERIEKATTIKALKEIMLEMLGGS